MTTKKSTKQHFPFQCQTKANTVKRGKSIERNFVIDFTSKQANDQSSELSTKEFINENVTNENRCANKTIGDELDIRYRNFRKDRLNYKNYLLSTDSSLNSSLYSPSISTSGSCRSASVKNKAQIPSLPANFSSSHKKKNLKATSKNIQNKKFSQTTSKSNYKTRAKEVLLSENYYESEYDSTLDYLISDYDDYENYDYDCDYESFNDVPPSNINNRKGKIRFVKGNSNLYNISEISELNTQSEIWSQKSQQHHHHHKKQISKQHQPRNNTNQNLSQKQKSNKTFRPKFCETEDLTESFLDDLTDHPRLTEEEEECNETIKKLLTDITTEINRVQSNYSNRRPLKISSPIHIFANNPTIQRIKGRIPASDVYMHVPTFDPDTNTTSVSQMSGDDNNLTISDISFNNFGSPSPIKARNISSHSRSRNKRSTNNDEINQNTNQANNEFIKKIKSRNVNYQQMINNQNQTQNDRQKLVVKRTNSKEQNIQLSDNEQKTTSNILTIMPNPTKCQDNSNKKQSTDQPKSQNLTQSQTKKMVQSLFANQDIEEAKQKQEEKNLAPQVSKAPLPQNINNSTTNDQPKKYPSNPAIQKFIQQNDEIIEDIKRKNSEKQEQIETVNLIPNLESSQISENNNQKERKINNPNSEIETLDNDTISNLSTINKVSNMASGNEQKSDKASITNDLLSDSYDDADQKTNTKNTSKLNDKDSNHISQDILFDEETYNTMSSFNNADEIILSEIRNFFDESSSRGESYKVPMDKDNINKENDDKSFSSLNNDDFLED